MRDHEVSDAEYLRQCRIVEHITGRPPLSDAVHLHIRAVVDVMPPLTAEQKQRLSVLVRPVSLEEVAELARRRAEAERLFPPITTEEA